jgi:hypothetical protein
LQALIFADFRFHLLSNLSTKKPLKVGGEGFSIRDKLSKSFRINPLKKRFLRAENPFQKKRSLSLFRLIIHEFYRGQKKLKNCGFPKEKIIGLPLKQNFPSRLLCGPIFTFSAAC